MSNFPDCRKDEDYNVNILSEKDRNFVYGFDYFMEMLPHIFEDLESFAYVDDLNISAFLLKIAASEKKKKALQDIIKDFYECERNELITSMIDAMDPDIYEANKKEWQERRVK